MNESQLVTPTTPTTKIPKPVNEVSEIRLDDELEALCQVPEYPLCDLEKKEVRHLLCQKLGRTSLVKHDINHHGRANQTKSWKVSNPPKG